MKAAEAAKAPGKTRARRGGRALSVQADGLQGRIRGRAALRRRRIPAQVKNEFEGDNLRFKFHLAPPMLAQQRPGHRRAEEDDLRPVDAAGVPRAGEVQIPARHAARSVRLQRRAPDRAQADRRLRGAARDDPRRAHARQSHAAVGLATIPEKIRGFGHVKQRHLAAAKADEAALLEQFKAGTAPILRAAE